MKIAVWDTYVKRKNNTVMHFDILVPTTIIEKQQVFDYGYQYLKSKPFNTFKLTAKECRFCHIEQATDNMINSIHKTGYFIIEMENCS